MLLTFPSHPVLTTLIVIIFGCSMLILLIMGMLLIFLTIRWIYKDIKEGDI